RQMLRRRFDRIEVIDLRGDVRRGPRGDVEHDEGVFNVMVGTSITLAIADGTRGDREALVTYYDCWRHGQFSRTEKLSRLVQGSAEGVLPGAIEVDRSDLDDFRPKPFSTGEWIALPEAFAYHVGGMQTKRNAFVYDHDRETLVRRIRRFHSQPLDSVRDEFQETRDRTASAAHAQSFQDAYVKRTAFRPLDVRFRYRHPAFGDFLRPALQAAWGNGNVGLYTHRFGVGLGPAVMAHSLMPDYDLWSGRGGYSFPLYDRRPESRPLNLKPELVAALTDAYGVAVTPDQVFDAILCLLSARSYTRRFAEDLEDVFPHVPFPSSPDVFAQAARIGAEIRTVETFARPPAEPYRQIARADTAPRGPLAPIEQLVDNGFALCADGSGRISNVPTEVWEFAVSGYRVLPRWLAAREGEIGPNFIPEMRDVAQRIAELLFLFGEADTILDATLADSLTREALGVAAEDAQPDDEQD
ncbi:MAG: hypothetical protein JSS00_05405, partial [Proteobacteria bacterium]|nr:hypothetical protein [Pseudomonadota bacterium]